MSSRDIEEVIESARHLAERKGEEARREGSIEFEGGAKEH